MWGVPVEYFLIWKNLNWGAHVVVRNLTHVVVRNLCGANAEESG